MTTAQTLAIIPARGGSKRIPGKNIRPFAGVPMIVHSIRAAQDAGCFDQIIVSTDDELIAEVALQYGASVPFIRPPDLADDHAGTQEVIAHAINWAISQGWQLGSVCCLYATAPFVRADDLRTGQNILEEGHQHFVFSATTFDYSPYRGFIRSGDGVEMLFPEHFPTRSQDLPEVLHDAGQFYWGKPTAWLTEQRLFSANASPLMLPRHRVQDIDTLEDWRRAELLWQLLKQEEVTS
ncbi:pseudaminic acid cytidylyltransferase [Aeromonas sp. PrichA-15]|nr:pseudaminic acid cytidylyltransferase [Aeromonas sp. PrichA-15]MBP4034491.1 pseudaminic acid cytidylyltransferase [Aeromonas sp. PrichA-15]